MSKLEELILKLCPGGVEFIITALLMNFCIDFLPIP